jgi:hypothetical protein
MRERTVKTRVAMARRRLRASLQRLSQLDLAERGLLLEATVCLTLARVLLRIAPFPRLARGLGAFVSPQEALAARAKTPADPERAARLAERVGWAVRAAARNLPFEVVCLPQAIAARVMLQRRGVPSILHFGVAKGRTKAIDAHAWLDAASVEVTGYPIAASFSEIACFV